MPRLLAALCLALAASTEAFAVGGAAPRAAAVRAPAAVAQFGTGNYDKSQADGTFLSPIAGPAKAYKDYGKYELDSSGEFAAKALAFISCVGLPVAFAVGIFSANV